MRASAIFRLITLTAIVVFGVLWYRERAVAEELEIRMAALQPRQAGLAALQAEREELREQLVARVADNNTAMAGTQLETSAPVEPPKTAVPLPLGEWITADAWENAGRATPVATVTTLLWAAAGGDQSTMQSALLFGDPARTKAMALYDSLPSATRSLYVTPEELIASVTMKNIPLTSAQVCWLHEADADHATVGVMLSAPKTTADEPTQLLEDHALNAPPRLANPNPNPLAVLSLERSANGWRVIVPVAAVDRIATELSPDAE